ncbi:unnamed protein product [Amoebophrya sp. A25]|nr:unnamed protein product [Amoebophrya sp. A25]|eukprot:GSA25T00021458001.1
MISGVRKRIFALCNFFWLIILESFYTARSLKMTSSAWHRPVSWRVPICGTTGEGFRRDFLATDGGSATSWRLILSIPEPVFKGDHSTASQVGGGDGNECPSLALDLTPDLTKNLAEIVNEAYVYGENEMWKKGSPGRTNEEDISQKLLARKLIICSCVHVHEDHGSSAVMNVIGQVFCDTDFTVDEREGDDPKERDIGGDDASVPIDLDTTAEFGMLAVRRDWRGRKLALESVSPTDKKMMPSSTDKKMTVGRLLIESAEELAKRRGRAVMRCELLEPRKWEHPVKNILYAWYTRLGYEPEVGVDHFATFFVPNFPHLYKHLQNHEDAAVVGAEDSVVSGQEDKKEKEHEYRITVFRKRLLDVVRRDDESVPGEVGILQ